MAKFTIDGTGIKDPSAYKIERYSITNMQRLANGEMVGDLIAKKRKFFLEYETIRAHELDNILKLIWESNNLFFTLKYVENGVSKTAKVYVGAIPTDLYRAGSGANWVWRDVAFNLIEK